MSNQRERLLEILDMFIDMFIDEGERIKVDKYAYALGRVQGYISTDPTTLKAFVEHVEKCEGKQTHDS